MLDYTNEASSLDFYFEGKPNEAFALRIKKYLDSILDQLPWLRQVHLVIESDNSFPHSSGIASSASSMSALALCLCSIEDMLYAETTSEASFYHKASYLSRLGSGSACRSVYPAMAAWGHHQGISDSALDYAVPITDIHPEFQDYHDDILIVSATEKSVSSSQGHQLMEGNPYAPARYQQAEDNVAKMLELLRTGDHFALGEIIESEALTLHALMMCSTPSYMLMKPETLTVIDKLRAFRAETNLPLFFTLDAGPNVHLLYPHAHETAISAFIQSELKAHCEDGRIIRDRVGPGPIQLK